jgi:hypothetical protein
VTPDSMVEKVAKRNNNADFWRAGISENLRQIRIAVKQAEHLWFDAMVRDKVTRKQMRALREFTYSIESQIEDIRTRASEIGEGL